MMNGIASTIIFIWLMQFVLGFFIITHSKIMFVSPEEQWMYEEWDDKIATGSSIKHELYSSSWRQRILPLLYLNYWNRNHFDNWAERTYGKDALAKSKAEYDINWTKIKNRLMDKVKK